MRILLSLILISTAFANVSPSVLLFNSWDYDSCSTQMQKVIKLGAKSVHIVPTINFITSPNRHVRYFCYQSNTCKKFDRDLIDKLEDRLYKCTRLAVKRGLDVSFTAHIDDASGRGVWRNQVIFDPKRKYEGFSYKEILLDPIARVINKLSSGSEHFYFSLQGEMGASVFAYPKRYRSIISEYRRRASSKLALGLSLNYNSLSGGLSNYNLSSTQKLIDSLDFLGYSFYHPVQTSIDKHFTFAHKKFLWELDQVGIQLGSDIDIHFSEVGLGGGTILNDGRTKAAKLSELKEAPYSGIYGEYSLKTSPWELNSNKVFRRNFYSSLQEFMSNNIFANKVTHAYFWNANSWDVLGLYNGAELYSDPTIINMFFGDN